jgi:hypothetical protein
MSSTDNAFDEPAGGLWPGPKVERDLAYFKREHGSFFEYGNSAGVPETYDVVNEHLVVFKWLNEKSVALLYEVNRKNMLVILTRFEVMVVEGIPRDFDQHQDILLDLMRDYFHERESV